MFGGSLKNEPLNENQHSFYYSGVGTYGNILQKVINKTFSPEYLDVATIINNAINDLQENYNDGDKIYVFGFSRGAAIARRFCGIMHKYLGYTAEVENLVEFIGVFDTVASIGIANLDDETKPISDVVFENGTISKNIKKALHLLSLDEQRVAFQPTLMNSEKRVKEIWFSGCHSDIGGGYLYDGLSDVTLDYMINEIQKRNLDLKVLNLNEINFSLFKTDEFEIKKEDLFIEANYLGKSHKKERVYPFSKATLSNRLVRVNVDDKPSLTKIPLVYYSVKQRVLNMMDYRPEALEDIKHYLEENNYFVQINEMKEYERLNI